MLNLRSVRFTSQQPSNQNYPLKQTELELIDSNSRENWKDQFTKLDLNSNGQINQETLEELNNLEIDNEDFNTIVADLNTILNNNELYIDLDFLLMIQSLRRFEKLTEVPTFNQLVKNNKIILNELNVNLEVEKIEHFMHKMHLMPHNIGQSMPNDQFVKNFMERNIQDLEQANNTCQISEESISEGNDGSYPMKFNNHLNQDIQCLTNDKLQSNDIKIEDIGQKNSQHIQIGQSRTSKDRTDRPVANLPKNSINRENQDQIKMPNNNVIKLNQNNQGNKDDRLNEKLIDFDKSNNYSEDISIRNQESRVSDSKDSRRKKNCCCNQI